MKKMLSTLAAAAGLLAAGTAGAAPVTLTFEDQTSFASLSYPGQPFRANDALLAVANDGTGPGAGGEFFSNNPSGSYAMFVTEPLPGERAAFTAPGGFVGTVSFFYAAREAGTVAVRDAIGNVLASLQLTANSTNAATPYDTWTRATLAFTGVAAAIDFTGAATIAHFDNVSFSVPEPATGLLLTFALAGVGLASRRTTRG